MVIGRANLIQDSKGIALMTRKGAKNEMFYSGCENSGDKQSFLTEALDSEHTPKHHLGKPGRNDYEQSENPYHPSRLERSQLLKNPARYTSGGQGKRVSGLPSARRLHESTISQHHSKSQIGMRPVTQQGFTVGDQLALQERNSSLSRIAP